MYFNGIRKISNLNSQRVKFEEKPKYSQRFLNPIYQSTYTNE